MISDLAPFHASISKEIWEMKYQMKDKFTGEIDDHTVEDTWRRIANTLASVEGDKEEWAKEFYEAMEDFKFIPAGRIIAGAGTKRRVTLFNCYVMGTIPDSMEGIFENLKEAALTVQQGGGIGYDFSTLRPKGAQVKQVAADASGPLTFMDVWDAMCKTVMSAGSRRGAMMATMKDSHPDIMDFIDAKRDPLRLRMFNMSVLVSDALMDAVKNDGDWQLVFNSQHYKTIRARDLWDKIMQSTYDYAEPGVIFIDRINRDNNLNYMENISATNPCGEQPLPPYGACLLGSINLAALVEAPYGQKAGIDQGEMKKLVRTAIRMMDNVNDVSIFPLERQRTEALNKRRIGLGITGLADALLMVGLRYGSDEAARRTELWMSIIAQEAYLTSIDLAIEKEPFPALDCEQFCNGQNFAARLMSGSMKEQIMKTGIRNSHLLSIAPTGTISLYAGNVSSGGEPIFAPSYTRKVLQEDGSRTEQRVVDYAVAVWENLWTSGVNQHGMNNTDVEGDEPGLPPAYVDAQTLTPAEHIKMQAALQTAIDTSISKTINVPEDIDFEDFKQVYRLAYDLGCKGCTTYRPNEITGSILTVEKAEPESVEPDRNPEAIEPRPAVLGGHTYKIKMGDDHALYVTITDVVDEWSGQKRPFEIFIATKNPSHMAWTTALTRMISAVFRRPHDSSFVAAELKAVFDPAGGGYWQGKYWNSTVAAIGEVIEQHMQAIGYGEYNRAEVPELHTRRTYETAPTMGYLSHTAEPAATKAEFISKRSTICPKCFSNNIKHENGCETCLDCGNSKCG